MITNIAAHTIDEDIITPGGYVLDAGCRDFVFSRYATSRGAKVVALDADPSVEDPKVEGVEFVKVALGAKAGTCDFALTDDLEARHLATSCARRRVPYISVPVTTISEIMLARDITMWDCVKLDIEGAEYDVLLDWEPVAKQVTIEFHDHVEKRSEALYDAIFARMERRYDCVHIYPGDTLFVLKELSGGVVDKTTPWWRLLRPDSVPWSGR